MLPIIVLIRIFLFLETTDLLTICQTSRLFYLPAISVLYKHITVVEETLAVFNALKDVFGTVALYRNVSKLSQVLKNDKISSLVVSLDVLVDLPVNDLVDKINVRQLTCIYPIREMRLPRVLQLCVAVGGGSFEWFAPLLRKLKILYDDSTNMSQLGYYLVKSDTVHQLTSLELQRKGEGLADLNRMNRFNDDEDCVGWVHLFKVLASHNCKLQRLEKLAIEGFVTGDVGSLFDQTINVKLLTHLDYRVKQYSHLHQVHYENNNNILCHLIHDKLTHLTIRPTYDCLKCQYNMIYNAMVDSLQYLDIEFEFLTIKDALTLAKRIKQLPNLKQLRFYDRTNQFVNQTKLSKAIGDKFEQIEFEITIFKSKNPIDLLVKEWAEVYKRLEKHVGITDDENHEIRSLITAYLEEIGIKKHNKQVLVIMDHLVE